MSKISIDHFEDLSFSTPEENILYDDVLQALAEQGTLGNTLRIWESPVYFIVLGLTGKVEDDVLKAPVITDKIPVLRRLSGGGTVVQGPGCLNYSFVLAKDSHPQLNDLRKSYQIILDGVLAVLAQSGITASFKPISDLALIDGELKFSGNAQRRGRKFILHHGTILYNFDLSRVKKYLAMPKDIPEYRKHRSHENFITNISLQPERFKKDLKTLHGTTAHPWKTQMLPAAQALLRQFIAEKNPRLQL